MRLYESRCVMCSLQGMAHNKSLINTGVSINIRPLNSDAYIILGRKQRCREIKVFERPCRVGELGGEL